jgi:hypothetical protein
LYLARGTTHPALLIFLMCNTPCTEIWTWHCGNVIQPRAPHSNPHIHLWCCTRKVISPRNTFFLVLRTYDAPVQNTSACNGAPQERWGSTPQGLLALRLALRKNQSQGESCPLLSMKRPRYEFKISQSSGESNPLLSVKNTQCDLPNTPVFKPR